MRQGAGMVTSAGFGGLLLALLPLIGIVTILQARHKRRRGRTEPVEEDLQKRQAAALESERRMAAYLAQRLAGSYEADQGQTEQEVNR